MTDTPSPSVIVIGAGVSGLSCARTLAAAGERVVVLERARGVGGRCATRRLDGQAVDFGVTFLHGRDPGFLEALAEVPGVHLPGWPSVTRGEGQPCHPDAFDPLERRVAFADGVNAFPRHLAAGLDVRLQAEVTLLERSGGSLRATLGAGATLTAPVAVLALAPEQSGRLLAAMPEQVPPVASAQALLQLSRSQACLALLALYPEEAPRPDWQACFPEDSTVLQAVLHDSAKRPAGARLALVLQARPRWSREHLDDPAWPAALLEEAGRLLGPWAARPGHTHAHRWRYARNDGSSELAGPVLLDLPGGARLGLCGDRFGRGGGVEAAFCSGRALARRLLAAGGRD